MTLTAQAQQREQWLAAMTPKCQKVAEEFTKKLGQAAKGIVLIKYDIGARLQEVMTKEEEYGSKAIEQLATYLNFPGGSTTLYALRQLSEQFDREFVEQQVAIPMANGTNLEVSHFLLIARVETKTDQKKLFARIRQECLSSRDLEKEIQAQYATRNKSSGGRKPKSPTSPEAGLQNLFATAQKLDNFFDTLDQHVFNKIDTFTASEIKPQLTEKLEQSRVQLEMLLKDGQTVLEKMTKVSARLDKLAATKIEAADAEDEAEEGPKLFLKKPPKASAAKATASKPEAKAVKKKPVTKVASEKPAAKKSSKKKTPTKTKQPAVA